MVGFYGPGCNGLREHEESEERWSRSQRDRVSWETEERAFSDMASPDYLIVEFRSESEDQPVAAPNAVATRHQASRNGYEAGRWSTIRRAVVTM